MDDLDRYDRAARQIAALTREQVTARCRRDPDRAAALLRMWYRWRLADFAAQVMAPMLREIGPVSPPGPLDRAIYSLPVDRPGHREAGHQQLVMTGRGVGKTTRQKIRRLHGLLYGWSPLAVAIAQTDPDAKGWIDTINGWAENPGDILARLFPELRSSASERELTLTTRFGASTILARGWTASMRGLNEGGRRPDSLDLDDVEAEERSVTTAARDNTQSRLTAKVLPLCPLEGGGYVTWCQTPVDPDAVAVRAARRTEDLMGWDVSSLPVISRWPDRDDLWAEARAIYFDADARPDKIDRVRAVRAFYAEHQAEMNEGIELLDPHRLGPVAVHMRLWDVGKTAFAREYEMRASMPGTCFDPASWPRHVVALDGAATRLHREGGGVVWLREVPMWAHLDTSDGGDDAALVVCAWVRGRVCEVGSSIWTGARLSRVLREVAPALHHFAQVGLHDLHWEPPPGAASVVEDEIRRALADAGLSLRLVAVPSTENKNARIVNTLEPLADGGLLSLCADIDRRAVAQAAGFRPGRHDNTDDWLDALQRCAEGLMGHGDHDPDPIDASTWGQVAAALGSW